MIRDTPALTDKVKDSKSRDSGNTILHKKFPGGHITMAGANSPASLASRPIRIVLMDETDRYPQRWRRRKSDQISGKTNKYLLEPKENQGFDTYNQGRKSD